MDEQPFKRATPSNDRAANLALLGLFATWIAIIIFQGVTRSGWMDEFFTAIVTDPHIPWQEHLPVWKTEPHPPTYSFVLWSYRHVVDFGQSMIALRSFGLALSILLAIGALAYWRWRKWPGLPLFAFFMFTSPSLEYFPQETRSYFLTAFGGIYAILYLFSAFENEAPDRPRGPDIAVGIAAAAMLSVHLLSIVFVAILFVLAAFAMAKQRRWAWLTTTTVIGLLIVGPAIAVTAVTIHDALASTMKAFWITRWQLFITVYSLPFATGAPIVFTLLWALRNRDKLHDRPARIAAGLAAAIIVSVLVMGCLSLIKPMLVVRYLCAPMAALAPVCAILLHSLVTWPKNKPSFAEAAKYTAVAIAAFASGMFNADLSQKSDWYTPAQALNNARSCATAVIPYLILNHDPDPANIWWRNFEWYAPGHAFNAATPDVQEAAAAQPCSIKLWAAHRVPYSIPVAYRDAIARTCAQTSSTALIFVDGFLIVDNQDRATIQSWRGETTPCEDMINSED
ncbi:MAG: putative rane protein [Hyphomicrobiales bacterium]|nr:putative rane protein [Hyphomicrobiales bacterium]